MSFGSTPLSTTTLGSSQFPVSAVAVPGHSGGNLTALEGGPASTDANNNETAPASIYTKDGSDVNQGRTTDNAVTGDTAGTVSAKLRGLVKISTDVWDSTNHLLKVGGTVGITALPTSATGTITSIAASTVTGGVQLLAPNANRKGVYVFNDSPAMMYLALAGSASTTAYTVQVPSNSFFPLPTIPVYTGALFAIWSSATGSARITEMS